MVARLSKKANKSQDGIHVIDKEWCLHIDISIIRVAKGLLWGLLVVVKRHH